MPAEMYSAMNASPVLFLVSETVPAANRCRKILFPNRLVVSLQQVPGQKSRDADQLTTMGSQSVRSNNWSVVQEQITGQEFVAEEKLVGDETFG